MRGVTELALRHAGYDVVVAGTKAEALRLCKEKSFDLLLGDIGLPDGDGYEVMRELAHFCGLKGIAFTGHGCESDIAKARTAGYAAHLLKPVEIDVLVSTVANVLADLPLPAY